MAAVEPKAVAERKLTIVELVDWLVEDKLRLFAERGRSFAKVASGGGEPPGEQS